ncbi:MAG: hypothetical protein PHF11_05855 [Candidatus Omnitrophica bacterium]|nr:hypothetical protein [Candidatus Omnitrophota bacterium]
MEIKCGDTGTLQAIKNDFSFFTTSEGNPEVFFEIFAQSPDYKELPSLKASFYTPRNICYKLRHLSFIDYFGNGLTIIDYKKNTYKIYCLQPHLRHEIAFLTILALAAERLDSRGMHRVHGLGIEANGKAVLILLPSGGGKTTLLLELLKKEGIKLVSEDSPLINSSGKILPFPLRIGVSYPDKPQGIPESHLHLIERMEFGPKYVIDMDYFKDRISKNSLEAQSILCGIRCLGAESRIIPLAKYRTLGEFIKNSVIGVGLYQGLEFLLQGGLSGIFKKSGVILSRFKNSCKVISGAKTYLFVIGSDRRRNAETLWGFVAAYKDKS